MLHIVGFFSKQEFLSFGTADVGLRPAILLPLLHVLTPPGWPGRRLAYIALVWTLVFRPAPPPGGCLGIHTLDVGQGLAVVLQTRSRTLLFDTGPAFAGGGDTAELVIAPFLQSRGISRIDTMVVSHGDLDHAGGVQTLIGRFAVGKLMVGEPVAPQGVGQLRCVDGQSWRWDGIDFRIVHPRPDTPWKGNNASCVLSVTAGRVELLFTGDIETPVERLLAYRGRLDQSDVVWVPHHGSRTSSSAALVEATRPAYAIVSTAFGNRWGFPRAAVVDRWQQVGATVLNTGTSGAISQRICHDGIQSVVENRVAARKYWHHAPLRGH
jgi:competence protein ComEC